jgi:PDZ domain-containing protein
VPLVRRLTPARLVGAGLVLLAIALAVLWIAPSSDYIFLPDRAHPVAPLVDVAGRSGKGGPGRIYYVDVVVRKATLFEQLFPGIRSGASLHPAQAVNQGLSDQQLEKLNAALMQESQLTAAAVAERELGIQGVGIAVGSVEPKTPAAKLLKRGDVVVSADGKTITDLAGLARVVGRHAPGQRVTLRVRRDGRLLTLRVPTVRSSDGGPHRTIVGFAPTVHLPVKVTVDAHGIGGPSAGLAFALQVMEEFGRDVAHGHAVAATGEIDLDGAVTAIGGVKQKTLGARAAHVDAFLVPAGDNAREARRYAGRLRIIPVHNLRDALRALATLGRA